MIINVGKSGLNTDIAPVKLPPDALTGGNNFLCTEGSVRSPTMRLKVLDLTIEPLFHFVWTAVDNTDKVVVSDGEKVLLYDTDGTEHDINTANRFTVGCQVTFTDLGTVLVVNSDEDGPFYYDPDTDALVSLPGWNSTWRCKIMASVRYNLVALNMTEGTDEFPQKLRWSNSSQDGSVPTLWTAALDNDAGDDILGETAGHIIGATVFRGSLWIGKTDSLYEMRYLGGQYVYSVTRRTGDIGISSHLGMTAGKNILIVLSRDDVYRFDGTIAQSLSDNRIRNKLIELSDNGSFDYAEIKYSPNQDLAFVTAVGTGRTAGTVPVYSFADDTWNLISFGDVYGFDLGAMTDDTDPELICYRNQPDLDTGAAQYQVERFTGVYDAALEGEYLFIDGEASRESIPLERNSMVEKVLPILRGQKLNIQIGVQDSQDSAIRWTPTYEIDPAAKKFIPVRMVGRYMSWRVYARARQPWYFDGLDVRTRPAGDKI
jgi:hypothetical protein